MIKTEILPPFWLKVRKEYVFDNFDLMTNYLKQYPYDSINPSSDYAETLACLGEIVNELSDELAATPFYLKPRFSDCDVDLALRIMAVYILAVDKTGRYPRRAMLSLASALTRTGIDTIDDVWPEMWRISTAVITQLEVKQYGFTWEDIATKGTFIPAVFLRRFAKTEFEESEYTLFVNERRGTVTLDSNGVLSLSPLNLQKMQQEDTGVLFGISDKLKAVTLARDAKKKPQNFDDVLREGRFLLAQIDNFKPSPKACLRDYTRDDIIPVRITHKNGIKFVAETIDPRYNRIEGKISMRWDPAGRPSVMTVRNILNPGDIVMVYLSDDAESDFAFEMEPALEDLYCDMAENCADRTDYAVHLYSAPKEHLWVSRAGIRLRIHQSKIDELTPEELEFYNTAIALKTPIKIHYYVNPADTGKDNFKVYAQPEFNADYKEAVPTFSQAEADLAFAEEFKHESADMATDLSVSEQTANQPLVMSELPQLRDLLIYVGNRRDTSPFERLKHHAFAALLARIANDVDTTQYIVARVAQLSALVDFCHNKEMPAFNIPERFADLDEIREDNELIALLREYRDPLRELAKHSDTYTDIARHIDMLVKASNSLRGIIGENELNNIKHSIARTLNLQEEYEPLVSDRTYYGIEDTTMEFKRSIVFPPANRRRYDRDLPDPDTQRWAILKAVCGFLNSKGGGQLLLGVNDNGYAEGIDADIEGLSRLKRIKMPNIDHYLLFVQYQIDHAFKEFGAPTLPYEITALNVSYQAETNAEGKTILRVKVNPYPYGVVGFADNQPRPADYFESYVRLFGRTVPVTDNMRSEIEQYKLSNSASSASRNIILISNAIENRSIIELLEYTSPSGVSDHRIEPYVIWKKRGLVYGWDITNSAPGLFTVANAERVVITDRHYTNKQCSADAELDAFGLLLDKTDRESVELRLTHYGRRMLEEAIPSATVKAVRGGGKMPWRFECMITDPAGIGRFCLSFHDHVKVASGSRVEDYLRVCASMLMK